MADHMFVRPSGQGSWTLVCSVRCIDRLIDMEDNGGKRSDFEEVKTEERSRCAHCHVCGGIVMETSHCQLHGTECPRVLWLATNVALDFARTYCKTTWADDIPDALWDVAENMSLRDPDLCGAEVANFVSPCENEDGPDD